MLSFRTTLGDVGADEPVKFSAVDVKLRSRIKGGLVVPGVTELDLAPMMGIALLPGIEQRDDAE